MKQAENKIGKRKALIDIGHGSYRWCLVGRKCRYKLSLCPPAARSSLDAKTSPEPTPVSPLVAILVGWSVADLGKP